MSRAAWLALGSSAAALAGIAALAACSQASPDERPIVDAGPAFACGDAAPCHLETEYCESNTVALPGCESATSYSCAPWADARALVPCGHVKTCACFDPASFQVTDYWATTCDDIDGGGVEIGSFPTTCAGCYGSPPARVERLARGFAA